MDRNRKHTPASREIMLNAIRAIRRDGDYRRELFAAIHLHSNDPIFFAALEKGITLNVRIVGLVAAEKMQIAICVQPIKELLRLQRKMNMAFALGRTETAEKTMIEILKMQDKVLVDPKQN